MFDLSRMNIAIPIDIMALNRRSSRPISKRLPHVTLSRCDNDSDHIAHYKYLSDRGNFYPYKYITGMRSIFTNCADPIKCVKPTSALPVTSPVERRDIRCIQATD
jgi:hypothetical protein